MATIPAPTWINTGAKIADGLDLLGLRQPVQAIGGELLDGITSVTPTIRYLSFSCWLIHRYAEARLPDRWKDFLAFAHRAEAALVMGNLLANDWIGGLVGPIRSQNRLATEGDQVTLDPVANTPAVALYLSSASQLGLINLRDDAVPQLTRERGLPLALALQEQLVDLEFAQKLTSPKPPQRARRADLVDFGQAIAMNQLSENEREILGNALLPELPYPHERPRVATYAGLLVLAKHLGRPPESFEYLSAACQHERFGDKRLDDWADAWLAYGIRDMLAVTQEFLCYEAIDELMIQGGENHHPVSASTVMKSLIAREDDLLEPLINLGLATDKDTIADLSIRDLSSRIEKASRKKRFLTNGLYRWEGDLTEDRLIDETFSVGAGYVSLVLVAWLLAAQRVPHDENALNHQLDLLASQEEKRVGIFQVVLPSIEAWLEEDSDLYSVMSALISQTISQHLSIAWSRMQNDLRKDVALISVDEGKWTYRGKQISAGRTISRLDQAIGWLQQLGWLDEKKGVSKSGKPFMDRALQITVSGAVA